MEQIRSLYDELDAPGALKLWQEAQRRNLPVTRQEVFEFTSKQGANQVLRSHQKFEGKIPAFEINGRWAADLIDYNARPSPDKNGGAPYQYILIVQDIFSRVIFTHALKNKDQETCRDAFESIVRRAGLPDRLDTDNGHEFKGEFQDYLNDEKIYHSVSDARSKNARATLDSAIKSLRQKLARLQPSENRRDWASLLARAVESHNKTVHGSLIGRAPYQVHWDKDLQFDLRNKAAQDAQQNNDAFTRKADQLTRLGGISRRSAVQNQIRAQLPAQIRRRSAPGSESHGERGRGLHRPGLLHQTRDARAFRERQRRHHRHATGWKCPHRSRSPREA